MITITYVDLLYLVLTVCAIVSTVALVIGITKARRTMARLDSLLARIEGSLPQADRLAREAEEALRSVRELSNTAGNVARDVEGVTSETRRAVLPLVHELAEQTTAARIAMRQLLALAVGIKAGLAALSKNKS